jgi:hypothetical protein
MQALGEMKCMRNMLKYFERICRPLPEEDGHVRHSVSFVLNAKEYVVDNPDPKVKLADFIRSVGYTGT